MESLEPGCVVIYHDPEQIKAHQLMVSPEYWRELERRGYYGGIILPFHVKMTSLNDEELAQCGLMRIPKE